MNPVLKKGSGLRSNLLSGLLALTLFSALSAGCALLAQPEVAFERDGNLTAMFEEARVPPGYTWYYFGPEAAPTAILGIKPQYEFNQGLWKKIDLTPEKLKQWTDYLDVEYRVGSYYYSAAHLTDRQGNRFGIWYSYHLWTTVKVAPDGMVSVYTPVEMRFRRLHPVFRDHYR